MSTENDLREQLRRMEEEAEKKAQTPKTNPLEEESLRKILHASKAIRDPENQRGVLFRQNKQWAIRTLFIEGTPLWIIARSMNEHGLKPRTIKSLLDAALVNLIPDNSVRFNLVDTEYVKAFGGRSKAYIPEEESPKIRKL